MDKRCTKCLKMKFFNEYHKDCQTKDGHQRRCIDCSKQEKQLKKEYYSNYSKQYYIKNIDKKAEYRANNKLKIKEKNQSARGRYSVYKSKCKMKSIEFDLTLEVFDQITKLKCYYCDSLENNGINGIDRIDNNLGYTQNNITPCCQICNYMKNNLSKDLFFEQIIKIYNKHLKELK